MAAIQITYQARNI